MRAVLTACVVFIALAMTETGIYAQPDWVTWRYGAQLMQHVDRTSIDRARQCLHLGQRSNTHFTATCAV
jgi:hypothetical protein